MDSIQFVLAALGEPTRFRLLQFLLERDLCVGALARELGISESAVSQHLKRLKEVGLVTGEKRGYWMHYVVNATLLVKAADDLRNLAATLRREESECSRKDSSGGCCCPSGRKSLLPDFRTKRSKGR